MEKVDAWFEFSIKISFSEIARAFNDEKSLILYSVHPECIDSCNIYLGITYRKAHILFDQHIENGRKTIDYQYLD